MFHVYKQNLPNYDNWKNKDISVWRTWYPKTDEIWKFHRLDESSRIAILASNRWCCAKVSREQHYQKLCKTVKNLIAKCQEIGASMSIKVHLIYRYLDGFHENMGTVSDKPGEPFHQVIKEIEIGYQGWWDEAVLANYYYSLRRDNPAVSHFRAKKHKFFPGMCVSVCFFVVVFYHFLFKYLCNFYSFKTFDVQDIYIVMFIKNICVKV